MKTIDEDIKNNQFRSSYLLYGEEEYLIKQYKQKLIKALVSEEDNMNFISYQGKNVPVSDLVEFAQTLPFFGPKRVLLVEDSGFFKANNEEICAYFSQIPETTCIIFVEKEVDKRTKTYKEIKNYGAVIEFSMQNEQLLTRWILSKIKKEGKQIKESALHLFLEKTGFDMGNIDKELEKLFCYTLNKEEIKEQDIEEITTEQVQNKIFEMVEAMTLQKQERALTLYYDLLFLKEPPMRILFLITRQFRLLLLVKEMLQKGKTKAEIAKVCKVPEFAVRKLQDQSKNYTISILKEVLIYSVEAEEAVKTGRLNDALSVELLLTQYSKKT